MTVHYCKFKLNSNAASLADVIFLHDQVNTSLGIWYAAIDLANTFSSLSLRPNGNIFLVARKVSIYTHSPPLRVY